MMSILEYSIDVNKSVEEIMKLCKKLDIPCYNEEVMLTEDDIILLDNEIQDSEDYITDEEDILEEKVENIISVSNIDVDTNNKKEKLKSKKDRVENNKANFQKERKKIYKHREKLQSNENEELEEKVIYKEDMTVAELATALEVSSTDVIKKLMKLGVMANLNYPLSYEVAELLVIDYGKEITKAENVDISNFENYELKEKEENLVNRPPVVTIMGHVDHGKTSLLDAIRKTNVVSGEAGGITQAIGAYQVELDGKKITFIDTPGHEAFTEMRARGANVTDVVVIIVAADDGIMPQTKESIDHAKAANVPIIVAINKIDKPEANVERILTELTEYGLTPEEWGGDTIVNRISAKAQIGIEELLENILLVSEMAELKANPNRYAMGTVLESKLDKKVGTIATVLVQNGTLRLGDPVVVGTSFGKVRTLKNDKGQDVIEALPSTPVEITGLSEVPSAGDKFMSFETEKQAKAIAEQRKNRSREQDTNKSGMTLEDLFGAIKSGIKEINVVLKTDVNGSLEAIKQSLAKIEVEDVRVKVILGGVGTITESDIVLANASNAIIIGFNVRPNQKTLDLAKEYNVDVKLYDIIYKMIEDIEASMKGMLEPIYEEVVTGHAEIRQIFKFSKVGNIAGSHVIDGTVKNGSNARLVRDGIVLYTGKIKSVQREKDQVKEVSKGMDCGITLENYQDIKENDIIEVYELNEIKR
ncbi:MAG: translation initiation factor IF-2 [Firmicutes bacterium]|nr:translation initiation factor IF-2 [Bacillota bacterium]